MKLNMPEGFAPPQNARPDEPFEVVATILPSKKGGFSLIALDGVKLPDEEDEDDEEEIVDPRTDSTNIRLPFEDEEP